MHTPVLVVVGLGAGRLTSSEPLPLPTPFVFFFKLLPLLRPCFLSLLVSPQVAPPFHRPCDCSPVTTLGAILFVFLGALCFEKNTEVVYGCVWNPKRLLTCISSHSETTSTFAAPLFLTRRRHVQGTLSARGGAVCLLITHSNSSAVFIKTKLCSLRKKINIPI